MFQKIICAFAILSFLTIAPAWADTHYSTVIDDLPLMTGMVEKSDAAVIFDKAQGRILETVVKTKKNEDDVIAFYSKTLPALGWQKIKMASFLRDGEVLEIFFTKENPKDTDKDVHFRIAPK